MEELKAILAGIEGSYEDFVSAVLTYVNNKPSRLDIVLSYLCDNPDASTSDVLSYISEQKDFYEDAAYAQVV